MQEMLSNLTLGAVTAVSPANLLYCLVGCLLGTLIGVLPGLGPAATIAMLLPLTFTLDPTGAIIMLAGIYYGAQYGGSTTAILLNIPGEATSVVTTLDGHKMARQGRAGIALSTAAIVSFFGGTVATLAVALFAPALSALALQFHAADYFSLMILGLAATIALAQGSILKALGMTTLGLLVGLVGVDINSGGARMTFGLVQLEDGVNLVAIAMGMFGVAEVIDNLADRIGRPERVQSGIGSLWPKRSDMAQAAAPALRGTLLGTVLGVLPGGGALLSSFLSYAVEKRIARDPSRFGNGAIEGVAGPEAANNAGAQTSFIPMLTLGIPSNVIMALMAGAFIMHGIQPGPGLLREQPALVWGLIVSMWIGNVMLVLLNLPLVGLWVRLATIPYRALFPAILVLCAIGVFTLNNAIFDIYTMIAFGLVGFVLRRLKCEPAPFIIAIVLGPMIEQYLRRAMLLSKGDFGVFVSRPLSGTFLVLAAVVLLAVAVPAIRRRRNEAMAE